MADRHRIDEAIDRLVDRLWEMTEDADDAKPVPVGFQRGSTAQWRRAVQENEEFRAAELHRLGADGFLSMWEA